MDALEVCIQEADFDLGAEVRRLREAYRDVGAVVAFLGTVRDYQDRPEGGLQIGRAHV